MRKFTVAAFLLALIMIFAGCNIVQVNEERDGQTAVIKIDGHEITKEEYSNVANYKISEYINNYGYPRDYLEGEDGYKFIKEVITNAAIEQKLLTIKAKEYGLYEFTQEEQDLIQTQYDNVIDRYKALSKSSVEDNDKNAGLSREELDKLIQEDYEYTLKLLNIKEELYMQQLEDQSAVEKLVDIITETPDPTESEIQTAYDVKVAEQQSQFTETPSEYETAVYYDLPIYYNLPDARKARHVLISLPDDIKAQISTYRTNDDDDAADALLKEALTEIKATADEVYILAAEGANFNELIAEYGEDPGMEEDNYYTVINPSQVLTPEFVAGLFSLKNAGEFTQPISSDFGYHIILYIEDIPEGIVALEDVKESIIEALNNEKIQELYTAKLEEWKEQMKIKIYESRIEIDLGQ